MKITYLLNKEQADGSVRLSEVTVEEWKNAVQKSNMLPPGKRRYFIRDFIEDGDEFDIMVIEVPYEDYLLWHREHMAAERNRRLGKKYSQFSLEYLLSNSEGEFLFADVLSSNEQVEEMICDKVLIEELRDNPAMQVSWARDLLDMCLQGKYKSCTDSLARKWGVSERTVRDYKRKFKDFLKKFLK